MEYIVKLIIVVLFFILLRTHREIIRLFYAFSGMLLLFFTFSFIFDIGSSYYNDVSVMNLSKFEIIMIAVFLFLSKSNSRLECIVSGDSAIDAINWLNSKYTDFIWIGIIPFYLLVLIVFVVPYNKVGRELKSIAYSDSEKGFIFLFLIVTVILVRNICLRFKKNRSDASSNGDKKEGVLTND